MRIPKSVATAAMTLGLVALAGWAGAQPSNASSTGTPAKQDDAAAIGAKLSNPCPRT